MTPTIEPLEQRVLLAGLPVITEIMYAPAPPTPAEVAAGFLDKDLFEYLELRNIGDLPVDLNGYRLTGAGTPLVFSGPVLEPGAYAVAVANRNAFEFRYGTSAATIAGVYDGALSNGSDHIQLFEPGAGPNDPGYLDFYYNDYWYDITDSQGYSLTIRDEHADLGTWGLPEAWRPSALYNGTPGAPDNGLDPNSVIINEVLARSTAPPGDWIELYNTTDQPIDLSGWYLSDNNGDLTKYRIPTGTVIPAKGYLVFTQDQHFGSGPRGFALSLLGEEACLSSGAGGVLGGYRERVDFGASPVGLTYGRHVKSTGGSDFVLMRQATRGAANSYPVVGPLVVNEVMYSPADPTDAEKAAGFQSASDFEFIELRNVSDQPVNLAEYYLDNAVGFSFGWRPVDAAASAVWTREAGATAAWQAKLSKRGDYEVFAWWDTVDAEGKIRSLDSQAEYRIAHAGGTTAVTIDQGSFTKQWVSLGTYTFEAGQAAVALVRGTVNPEEWTIADQVRFARSTTQVIVDNKSSRFTTTGSAVTTLAPGQHVAIVNNLAAFNLRYEPQANGILVAGEFTGDLPDTGGPVDLRKALPGQASGYIPVVRVDRVNYTDKAPWPALPPQRGCSLARQIGVDFGNDPDNWGLNEGGGSPGAENVVVDSSAPPAPANVSAAGVTPRRIDLTWNAATDRQSGVDHYVIYRDGAAIGTSAATSYSDQDVAATAAYLYEVSAVNGTGIEGPRSSPQVEGLPQPTIWSAYTPDATHVKVKFVRAMEQASAELVGNYVVRGPDGQPVEVTSALQEPGGLTVTLTLAAEMLEGQRYTVTANALRDLDGNPIEPNATAEFPFRVVPANLIAWWPFDDGQGNLAEDATRNGRDAQVVGATWTTEGRIGGALRFDGIDDYVLDDDGELYANGLTAVTLAMWIQPDAAAVHSDRGFFTTRDADAVDCLNVRYAATGPRGKATDVIAATLSSTYGSRYLEGAAGSHTTAWQHVALTWTSGQKMALYVNGVVQVLTYAPLGVGGTLRNATKLLIGQGSVPGMPWQGLIDDVRVYKRALRADEILALANLDPEAVADAYWLDEDTTLTVSAAEGVLANDADPDSGPQPLTVWLLGPPQHGSVNLLPDGSFDYTPQADFYGTDSFTYQVSDGVPADARTGRATLTVRPAPDPPQASFEADSQEGDLPFLVQFNASDSYDPDDEPLAFLWDFGDGLTGQGMTIGHVFRAEGVHTVTLTVVDPAGADDQATTPITVHPAPPRDLTCTGAIYAAGQYFDDVALPATVSLANLGQADVPAGVGHILEVRLSADLVWGNADDVIVLQRPDDAARPAAQGWDQPVELTIPAGIPAGAYHLAATVDASDAVYETDEMNNRWWSAEADVVILGSRWPLGGRDKVVFADADGDIVTIALSGPGAGFIRRPDQDRSDAVAIILNGDVTGGSALTITVRRSGDGDGTTTVGEVVVHGSLKSLSAKTTDLGGSMTVHGLLGSLVLGDVADGHAIEINADSLPVGLRAKVTIALGRIADTTIDTHGLPIGALTVTAWTDGPDGDDQAGQVQAPWVGKLTANGYARGKVAGDFGANLVLTGADARGNALGSAAVAGRLGGLWDLTAPGAGDVGPVSFGSSDWVLNAPHSLVRDLDGKGTDNLALSGSLTALAFGKIATRGDLAAGIVALGKDAKGLSIGSLSAATVQDVSVNVPGGIGAIAVGDWLAGGGDDTIRAGWIGRLTAKGDFEPGLDLSGSGAPAGKNVLGPAKIGGDLGRSSWKVIGAAAGITVAGAAADWRLDVLNGALSLGRLAALKLGEVENASITVADAIGSVKALGWTGGSLEADSIASLTITGRRGSKSVPEIPGNFGAGLILHGQNVRPDEPALGSVNIAHDLDASIWKVAGAVGKLTVRGTARNSKVLARGGIAALRLGAADGSDFLAGVDLNRIGPADRFADRRGDFADVDAAIGQIRISGWRLPKGDPTRFVISSNFSAPSLGAVTLTNADGGAGSGLHVLDALSHIKSVRHVDTLNRDSDSNWTWRPGQWFPVVGSLIVEIV